MNKSQFPVLIFLLAVLGAACQSNQQTEHQHQHHPSATDSTVSATSGPVADLEKQVLATHDSIMPRMSDLIRLKKEVAARQTQASGSVRERGAQIGRQLQEADQAMMDWMHQYKGDTLRVLKPEQALAYLKIQREKVTRMSQQMKKSLADAEKYLNE